MSKWKYRLNLKDLWEARDKGNLTIQELAKKIAVRLRHKAFYKKFQDDLDDIIDYFENCTENVTEFDCHLGMLYDWADGERCWIATRF